MSSLIEYITVSYKCLILYLQYFSITKICLGFRSGTYICDMSSVYIDSTIKKGVCKNRYEALQLQIQYLLSVLYDCNSYIN
jgi:hypothetical protein